MEIQVSDYVDVEQRALDLGCNVPIDVAILPENFETAQSPEELIHEGSATTIRVLLRQAGIPETRLEKEGVKIPTREQKSWDWVGPVIFVCENVALPLVISLIANYLSSLFKGHHDEKPVKVEFVKKDEEATKSGPRSKYRRITLIGTPKELRELDQDMLERMSKKLLK